MTRASLLILAIAVGGMGCDAAPITGPGPALTAPPLPPAPPAPPAGSWIVRGTVFEDLPVFPDERPIAGVPLRVFGGGRVVEVISRADGSYEADMPDTAFFIRVVASGPWYVSPCPAFSWGGAERIEPIDVHVVSGAVLQANNRPNIPSSGKEILGQVLERISGRLEPVSGATVTLHGSERLQNPVANTVTDKRGMYALCYVTPPDYVVEARKEGYAPVSVPAVIGWDFETTDLILTRQ